MIYKLEHVAISKGNKKTFKEKGRNMMQVASVTDLSFENLFSKWLHSHKPNLN